jgi:beta-galactosidase
MRPSPCRNLGVAATLSLLGIACSSNAPSDGSGGIGHGSGGASGGVATSTGGAAGSGGSAKGTGGGGLAGGTKGTTGGAGGSAGGTGASGGALGRGGSGSGSGGADASAGRPSGGSGGGGSGSGVGGRGSGGGAGGADAGVDAAGAAGGSVDGGGQGDSVSSGQAYNGARGRSFNDGWKFHLGDVTGAQQTTFDDSSWRSLALPHDWSAELPFNKSSKAGSGGGLLDGGVGWYRKTFTLDDSYSARKVRIELDGVYMNSEVWINGTSVGTRPYGYSTFEYDLTPYVKVGAGNVIAVRVDNSSQPNSRWYSGSGIYRNVWLTSLNPVHFAFNGTFITTPSVSTSSAKVSIAADVENQSTTARSVTIATTIVDGSGTEVATDKTAVSNVVAGATSTFNQSLTVSNPHLWSIEDPYLYKVKVVLQVDGDSIDTYVVPVGLRFFAFDSDKGFSLNGKTVKIQGMCNHHDLGAIGVAYHRRALERQLQMMKKMGVNAIRTSHNPPTPELLDLADQMGLLVKDEAFDVWETGKNGLNDYHLYFTKWAQTDLQDFVRRDRNHASVIMWSIGNEIQGASTATASNLIKWAKAVDPTRPVTWACNDMRNGTNRAVAALLDLQGYNYLHGTSPTSSSFIFDDDHAANPSWKIFGSEMESGGRSRGFYSTPADNTSTAMECDDSVKECSDYPNVKTSGSAASYEQMYVIDINRPYFAGNFVWTGFDYGGEPWPYEGSAKSSYFGMVDTAGFPKNGYYFYQSRYTAAPMVHILPHWNWTAGTKVIILVYGNCDSVELFLNDVSQGSRPFPSRTTTHLEWSLTWAKGTVKAACTKGGTVVATDQVTTADAPAKVALSVDRATIAADGQDLAYITADVQDAAGVFVPTANNSITFAVSGAGKLAGVDNGDPIDLTAYSSPTRKAFSGKALAIVQSTGAPGPITVTATSSGLTAGSVSVTAR